MVTGALDVFVVVVVVLMVVVVVVPGFVKVWVVVGPTVLVGLVEVVVVVFAVDEAVT